MTWQGRKVLVTGGAAFIGSHLVDALAARGARVRVVEDLSSGTRENLRPHLDAGRIDFLEGDLRDPAVARSAVEGMQVVFHLAAAHGGRGYVDLHQAACAGNFLLDGLLFEECRRAKVEKIVYEIGREAGRGRGEKSAGAVALKKKERKKMELWGGCSGVLFRSGRPAPGTFCSTACSSRNAGGPRSRRSSM